MSTTVNSFNAIKFEKTPLEKVILEPAQHSINSVPAAQTTDEIARARLTNTPVEPRRWDDRLPAPMQGIFDTKREALCASCIACPALTVVGIPFAGCWSVGWLCDKACDALCLKVCNKRPDPKNACLCPICPETQFSQVSTTAPEDQSDVMR